jgi:CO/xanthine dehydrogenase FAD-binding subunit
MYHVVGYHRPASLAEAVRLLAADGRVALAGGVHMHHDGGAAPAEVVDLQAVGLDTVEVAGPTATLGATVRLQALVDDERIPTVVREAAQAEHPSALRTLATVGGTIATASGDSLLLAALLVHDAVVRLASADHGERTVSLSDLLATGRRHDDVIVGVTLQIVGAGAIARTGRTPRDVPIVGAVGRRVADPTGDRTRLALCGIGGTPVLVEPGGVGSIQPIDDHRATASYRRHLAEVLCARVLAELA